MRARGLLVGALVAGAAALIGPAAALAADGTIKGHLSDATTGDPIEGIEACVYLVSHLEESSEEEVQPDGCDVSDPSGDYEIAGLAPGDYYVEFWSELNYVNQLYDGRTWEEDPDPLTVPSGGFAVADAELEPGAEIEGHVFSAAIGHPPIQHAEVLAFSSVESGQFGGFAFTDANGKYKLIGVPAGSYAIAFWTPKANFVTEYFDNQLEAEEAEPVTVVAGAKRTGIDAELEPAVTISGHVYDADTNVGLAGIDVCAIELEGFEREWCSKSEATGDYSMERLRPGSYKVEFLSIPGLFSTQFFDGKATLGAADTIVLPSGATRTGVNAALQSTKVSKVPLSSPVPVTPPAAAPPGKKIASTCRKGTKLKKIKGKRRCVKIHKKHRHGKRHHRNS